MKRCEWCLGSELYIKYHDEEWGKPIYDDQIHFEFMVLESAQAGLSWSTILNKRENYKIAYDNFNPEIVKEYDEKKIEELINNKGIVRNRKKIESSINNAKVFIEIQKEFGSFTNYIWGFTDFKPVINSWTNLKELPAKTELSQRIAKDLKKRGCKFLGPTIIYSHLQATGIVNDHLVNCLRYNEVQKYYKSKKEISK
ncbi:DNA-3-methyladenine glycosylase I [Clostridium sediminicola]|uniref:DNA-3-methyladenine glycosylase I n=1 Tax=Clostridium sediminicola TaxID=3114879 RepID=UPI0031F1C83D